MQYFISDKSFIAHTSIFPQSFSTSLAAIFEVNCAAYPGKACFHEGLGGLRYKKRTISLPSTPSVLWLRRLLYYLGKFSKFLIGQLTAATSELSQLNCQVPFTHCCFNALYSNFCPCEYS
jgi:hypothetical protein